MSNNYSNEIPVKEISELLDITTKKLPELVQSILNSLYSPEAASNMGKAIGSLYKELVASGIPQDVAVKMASNYMISLKDVLKGFNYKQEDSKNDSWE